VFIILLFNFGTKVQISEHNTKQKPPFFVFIVERQYFRRKSKVQISEHNTKQKPFFLFLLSNDSTFDTNQVMKKIDLVQRINGTRRYEDTKFFVLVKSSSFLRFFVFS